jgi:hypothetical protein
MDNTTQSKFVFDNKTIKKAVDEWCYEITKFVIVSLKNYERDYDNTNLTLFWPSATILYSRTLLTILCLELNSIYLNVLPISE